MAKLETIFDGAINDYESMDAMLETLPLTLKQYRIAKEVLAQFIPTRVRVQQRTPKSVTWFDVKERLRVTVDNRGLPNIRGR